MPSCAAPHVIGPSSPSPSIGTLLTTTVTGRTSTPGDRQARNGTWPGRGPARAPAAAAAVGEPRRASTTLMWLPFGTSPDHASPTRPSSGSIMRYLPGRAPRAARRHRASPRTRPRPRPPAAAAVQLQERPEVALRAGGAVDRAEDAPLQPRDRQRRQRDRRAGGGDADEDRRAARAGREEGDQRGLGPA